MGRVGRWRRRKCSSDVFRERTGMGIDPRFNYKTSKQREKKMQKWEYLVLVRSIVNGRYKWADKEYGEKSGSEVLNELGQQGWELTTTTSWKWGGDASDVVVHYIFKRPC